MEGDAGLGDRAATFSGGVVGFPVVGVRTGSCNLFSRVLISSLVFGVAWDAPDGGAFAGAIFTDRFSASSARSRMSSTFEGGREMRDSGFAVSGTARAVLGRVSGGAAGVTS
jgi:hypothetical protein